LAAKLGTDAAEGRLVWTPLARPHKAGRTIIRGLPRGGRNRRLRHENARGGIPGRSQPTDEIVQRAITVALRRAVLIDRTTDLLLALGKHVQADRLARRTQQIREAVA
jgi:hypothetical protein